jgi:hypothetical protein
MNLFNAMTKKIPILSFLVFLLSISISVFGQVVKEQREARPEKRIGVARIQIFASPAKGTPIADIANLPLFFGSNSDYIKYHKKAFNSQLPPTTGDSIQEMTSDTLAVYFKQDMWSMSGYDDAGGNSRAKRNMIHDLPTENPQKLAVDSVFDEAIDIGCFWTFTETADKKAFVPTVMMKMEIYDRSGQARPEKSVTLLPHEIKTTHFRDSYGVDYDFVKGIQVKVLEDGGIMGNVIADVYLQALNKLLAKRI